MRQPGVYDWWIESQLVQWLLSVQRAPGETAARRTFLFALKDQEVKLG
jgi:hypothetical protein